MVKITSPSNMSAALAEEWDKVDIHGAAKAKRRVEKAIEQIDDLGLDGVVPPKNTAWSKTHACAAAKAKEAGELKSTISHLAAATAGKKTGEDRKDRKKKAGDDGGRTGGGGAAKRSKYVGDVLAPEGMASLDICPDSSRDRMTKAPCGQSYRDGLACRFGKKCRFNHKPINDLCLKDQKAWVRKILTTPSLQFNPVTVNASI